MSDSIDRETGDAIAGGSPNTTMAMDPASKTEPTREEKQGQSYYNRWDYCAIKIYSLSRI